MVTPLDARPAQVLTTRATTPPGRPQMPGLRLCLRSVEIVA